MISPQDQDSTMTTTPKSFSLRDLPTEIWVQIGKLIADDSEVVTWESLQDEQPTVGALPALAQTCRILRHELLPYFYRTPDRIASINTDTVEQYRSVAVWLAAIDPKYRPHLRGVRVRANHVLPTSSLGWETRRWVDQENWKVIEDAWSDRSGLQFLPRMIGGKHAKCFCRHACVDRLYGSKFIPEVEDSL